MDFVLHYLYKDCILISFGAASAIGTNRRHAKLLSSILNIISLSLEHGVGMLTGHCVRFRFPMLRVPLQ